MNTPRWFTYSALTFFAVAGVTVMVCICLAMLLLTPRTSLADIRAINRIRL